MCNKFKKKATIFWPKLNIKQNKKKGENDQFTFYVQFVTSELPFNPS